MDDINELYYLFPQVKENIFIEKKVGQGKFKKKKWILFCQLKFLFSNFKQKELSALFIVVGFVVMNKKRSL